MIRWLKFNFVGGLGIGVQLAVLTVLKSGLGFHYLLATALAVEAAVIHNFIWHERFTWKDRERTTSSSVRFIKFNLSNGLLSLLGNLLLMKFLAGFFHLNYLAANLIAITICSLANFLISDRFVFQPNHTRRSIVVTSLIICCISVHTATAGTHDKPPEKYAEQMAAAIEQTDRQFAAQDRALQQFIEMPPEKRVQTWLKSSGSFDMTDVLIAQGLDVVPYLTELVRKGGKDRLEAVSMLCKMDRFVPASELVIPEVAKTYITQTGVQGLEDPFMQVDGRRIGKQGYDAVQWAASQTRDQKLRLYARHCSGLLREDFKVLSLPEQIATWRKWTIQCDYPCWGEPESEMRIGLAEDVLAEEAPDSIFALVNLVENDNNGFVRLEAIRVLEQINSSRMRLHGTELGRHALDVSLKTLDPANPKRLCPVGFLRSGLWRHAELQLRESSWKSLRALTSDDNETVGTATDLTIMYFAFKHFYGEELPAEFHSNAEVFVRTPELKAFVAYLTKTDPYFPSWAYFHTSQSPYISDAMILHPDFRKKVDLYHQYWLSFQATRHSPN